MSYLKRHVRITDMSVAPFDNYLLVLQENDGLADAYEIRADAPLRLHALLEEVFPDEVPAIVPQNGGPNYACIKLNGDAPNSVKVWGSCDFYLEDTP